MVLSCHVCVCMIRRVTTDMLCCIPLQTQAIGTLRVHWCWNTVATRGLDVPWCPPDKRCDTSILF